MSDLINQLLYEYIIKIISPTINMVGLLESIHNPLMLDGEFIYSIYKYLYVNFPTLHYNVSGSETNVSLYLKTLEKIDMIKRLNPHVVNSYNLKLVDSFKLLSKYDIILSTSTDNLFKKYTKFDVIRDFIFIKKCLSLLNINGRMGIIIHNKLLFSNKKKAVNYRKYLIEKYNIYKIILINNIDIEQGISVIFIDNIKKTQVINVIHIEMNSTNIIEKTQYILNINDLHIRCYNIHSLLTPSSICDIDLLLNNIKLEGDDDIMIDNICSDTVDCRKRSYDDDIDNVFKKIKLYD